MTDVGGMRLSVASASTPAASSRMRVRNVAILVPALLLVVGGAASTLDVRLALLASVVVIGWTQLVGL
jgi:hypothetical protein